ncbi:MAG TPA: hypothetical protein GXZ52_07860 [Clostridiales bacterium]|nr:hypothetical protein [Clostridiales bacterium]
MDFTDMTELTGESMPKPRSYLTAKQKDGSTTLAAEIFNNTWQWLKERGCAQLITMSQNFMKQANNIWFQIYQVVRENCTTEYRGVMPQDDAMEKLLNARRGVTGPRALAATAYIALFR